jgi:hypothetical protein
LAILFTLIKLEDNQDEKENDSNVDGNSDGGGAVRGNGRRAG